MKKNVLLLFFFIIISICVYPSSKTNKIEEKLAAMNIKKYIVKDNFSKMIPQLYLFINENKLTGGIALTTFEEYNVDIYIILLKYQDYYLVKTVKIIDENAMKDKKRMKELIDVLDKMKEIKITNISDSITGATEYSKRIYFKIKITAMLVAKELDSVK